MSGISLKNLVPVNTRAAELISSASLIIFACFALIMLKATPTSANAIEDLEKVNVLSLWFFMLVGMSQFIGIILCGSFKSARCIVRCIASWFAGIVWIWVGISAVAYHLSLGLGDVVCVILGLTNFYAVIINSSLLFRNTRHLPGKVA